MEKSFLALTRIFTALLAINLIDRATASSLNPSELEFDWIAQSEEFASISVTSIDQDQFGFIWVATRDGLYRYDGYEFREYRFSNSTAEENYIDALFIDSMGEVWVGTRRALRRYNLAQDRFDVMIETDIRSFGETPSAQLYAISRNSSAFKFDRKAGNFSSIGRVVEDQVYDVANRNEGGFWLAGDQAVYQLDSNMSLEQTYPIPPSLGNQSPGKLFAIAEDHTGKVWIGTEGAGLATLEPKQEKYTFIHNEFDGRTLQIVQSPDGLLYVGSTGGLSVFDVQGKRLARHIHQDVDPRSIARGSVYAIDFDQQGNLWLGTSRAGVSRVLAGRSFQNWKHSSYDPNGLSKYGVSAVFEDSRSQLWLGYYYGGLDRFDLENKTKTFYRESSTEQAAIGLGTIKDIVEDKDGNIWIATSQSGLYKFTYGIEGFQQFSLPPQEGSPAGSVILKLLPDTDGSLLVAFLTRGIFRFSPENGTFTQIDTSGIPWIGSMTLSKENDLWLANPEGLHRYDRGNGSFHHVLYPEDASARDSTTNDAFLDADGIIWIATSSGLWSLNPDTYHLINYTTENGLPNPSVSSISGGLDDSLWLGTKGGLSQFSPSTKVFSNFIKSDGISSEQFLESSTNMGADGTVYFGSEGGLTFFRPERIKKNTTPPNIAFTRFSILNKPVEISAEDGILPNSLQTTQKVTLPPHANVFSFEFAALNFLSSDKNEYAYMLEGFDSDWVYSEKQRNCTYTNLDPGEYTLRVKASNNDGVWNEEGISIRIEVLPWFWQTQWFLACVVGTVIAIAAIAYKSRIRSIKTRKRELEKTVQERTEDLKRLLHTLESKQDKISAQNTELNMHREHLEKRVQKRTEELEIAKNKAEQSDRLKSAFLANMSHEIRTPMNAIMGFLEILDSIDITPEERTEYSEIIRSNGKSLMLLIDDILDISRLEAGELRITSKTTAINDIMSELEVTYQNLREESHQTAIDLKWDKENSTKHLAIDIDSIRLKQILGNLLSNALKFTEEGYIHFGYRTSPQTIEFSVRDSGIGISEENIGLIFNRFGKIEDDISVLYRGVGLGLSIVQKLAELMGGTVAVTSKRGEGSEFTVTFPLKAVNNHAPENQGTGLKSVKIEKTLEQLKTFTPFRILVAEDESPNFQYIESLLQQIEAEIFWAKDGNEAVTLIEKFHPDLVLMDLKMPNLDGQSAINQIRESGNETPIIIQSAFSQTEETPLDKSSSTAYLHKPFTPQQLFDCLLSCLTQKKQSLG